VIFFLSLDIFYLPLIVPKHNPKENNLNKLLDERLDYRFLNAYNLKLTNIIKKNKTTTIKKENVSTPT